MSFFARSTAARTALIWSENDQPAIAGEGTGPIARDRTSVGESVSVLRLGRSSSYSSIGTLTILNGTGRPSNRAAMATLSIDMPTAVNPCSDQFRLDLRRRAGQAVGDQGQRPVHRRGLAMGAFLGRLVSLATYLPDPLPGDAESGPDFGQRVLPAVFPAVIADEDFAVPLEGRRRRRFR